MALRELLRFAQCRRSAALGTPGSSLRERPSPQRGARSQVQKSAAFFACSRRLTAYERVSLERARRARRGKLFARIHNNRSFQTLQIYGLRSGSAFCRAETALSAAKRRSPVSGTSRSFLRIRANTLPPPLLAGTTHSAARARHATEIQSVAGRQRKLPAPTLWRRITACRYVELNQNQVFPFPDYGVTSSKLE